ncbi:putative ABC transport system permease protein [Lactobacillus colini]|uniref:ABC transport system permease protein n=1 Tax=Lactobacillus colini TaxID=1819254 RepID=A0ABS4MF61_9LACO|nr:ABC transporter permease [Lactobacillus colini]MBP2058316.1 putative ABC transport system permease protein [Lactobacillus colini]
MLWKLSFTGLKSRFKDYVVLFSGLTLASAIFYMFMTIALNPAFLKGSLSIAFVITKLVFALGIVLLGIISLVYITYANSFLLSMRKKDYGVYMMLGARNSKIGKLIFSETLIIGFLASVLGIVIGIFVTQIVSQILVSQLGLQIHKYLGFYLPAIFWTLVFFIVLFLLAAIWNRHKLIKTSVLDLINEDQKPVKLHHNKVWKIIEAIMGIALLAVGYWAMADYGDLKTKSLWIGFFTIVIGSYFTFDSFFTSLVILLRSNKKFKSKKLRSFTLGQLQFRLTDYTKLLSVISLLFALALGAITVGLNFNNLVDSSLKSSYYDVMLYNPTKSDANLKHVSVRNKTTIDYKIKIAQDKKTPIVYVNKQSIANSQLKYQHMSQKKNRTSWSTKTITVKSLKNPDSEASYQLLGLLAPFPTAKLKLVSEQTYQALKSKNIKLELLEVNNFRQNFNNIEKLQNASNKRMVADLDKYGMDFSISFNNFKADQYRLVSSVASGFEFMGFFLGIAFLAMLASTLMFKVLSGAASDKIRYKMLWKIGARMSILKASIRHEIAALFVLPASLGVVDVLFGLQFFKSLLEDPYDKIWIPFTIFFALYLLYYLITVKLYQDIVLKKD